MQPLGLSATNLAAYHARLASSHDFRVEVDVMDNNDVVIGSLDPLMLSGQVNIQRDAAIRRTATLSLFDPDFSLNFDEASPFDGAVYFDRMIRVRHTMNLPGFGPVEAIPFTGPIVKLSRDQDVLTIEAQDKALFGIEGCPPLTIAKGTFVVEAIRQIMAKRTGEKRFRFPVGVKARLTKPVAVGWKQESSAWVVCQQLAGTLGMQLFYSCDGWLTLRRPVTAALFDFAEGGALTSAISVEHDLSRARNFVRVSGEMTTKKTVRGKNGDPKKVDVKHVFTAVSEAPTKHPLNAARMGRNGVARYLPLMVDDNNLKSNAQARTRAAAELNRNLPGLASCSFGTVPVFHLDVGDPVRVSNEGGLLTVGFDEASIPLTASGDASVGTQRRVSTPRRR